MLHLAKPVRTMRNRKVTDGSLEDIAGRVFKELHPGAEYLRKQVYLSITKSDEK